METSWYFRLFLPWISWFAFDLLLLTLIKPKRMSGPGGSKLLEIVSYISIIVGWVLAWFIPYSINIAFWIGLVIIILGLLVSSLSFANMREQPEKKQAVVDWGIYRFSRHPHVLTSLICILGTVVMGWNTDSIIYIILWVYFILYAILSHYWVLSEENLNAKRFGQEYVDYMKRTPRWIGIPKSEP